jgi:hypothetical protein
MKYKLVITLMWVLGTFLLLSWFHYAANDYNRSMLTSVTGEPGVQPTLERAMALWKQKKLEAETIEQADAINEEIIEEMKRYGSARRAEVSRRQMIQRVWLLWGVSAFVPVLFLWWSHLASLWKRLQSHPAADRKTEQRVGG